MENIKTIGQKLTGVERRDAIHIAIFPAVAAEDLRSGDEVGLVYGTTNQIKSKQKCYDLKPIGIVDPFLEYRHVEKGESCWVFMFPGTITGLRHEWTHPALDAPVINKSESEEWLRHFADKWNFDYEDMILNAQEKEGYVVAMGIDLHSRGELDAGDEALFWEHVENLTGATFDEDHRMSFGWSCSC